MKKKLFRVMSPALILAALLTAACGNLFEGPASESLPAVGKGIARISIGGKTAEGRTLQPDHLALYYALEFTKGEEIVTSFINNDTATDVELEPGTWSLDVKGYLSKEDFDSDPDYPVITGEANGPVEISDGVVTPVRVILTAAQTEDGVGWISFNLSFPDTVDSAVLDVKPLLGAPTTLYQPVNLLDPAYTSDLEDGTLRSAGQVDEYFGAGFYRLNYTLIIGGGAFPRKVVRTMVVHIYDGLVSPLAAAYAPEDFTETRSFSSLADLSAYLGSQSANTRDNPYVVVLEDLEFRDSTGSDNPFFYNSDKLGGLYNAFQGKYVALDLSGCAGNIPDTTSANAGSRGTSRNLIVSLILPDSMAAIGEHAFNGCGNMVSVDLPGALTDVGVYAFQGCSVLASVDFEESPLLQSLGNSSFYQTALTSLTLPASVNTIANYAFMYCANLVSADISACQITQLNIGVFRDCVSLSQIFLPAGLETIGDTCFLNDAALEPVLDFSSFSALTTIMRSAFSGASSLETVILPASLQTLGGEAFGDSGLTTVDLSACTALADISTAFRSCAGLTALDLSATAITSLNVNAFGGSGLASITLPATLTTVPYNAFQNLPNLRFYSAGGAFSAVMDNRALVKTEGAVKTAVAGPGLTGNIDFTGSGITHIGREAFYHSKNITGIVFEEGLLEIAQSAFQRYNDEKWTINAVVWPSSLTTIGANAFYCAFGPGLTVLNLPDKLESVGEAAFINNQYLVTVNWPNSAANLSVGANVFTNGFSPDGSNPTGALMSITLPNGLTSMSGTLFANNPNLATVDISRCAGLTDIGSMFRNLSNLTSVDLSGTQVTSLEANAFAGCVNLESLILPAALDAVAGGAFTGCSKLVFDLGSNANFTLKHNDKALATVANALVAFPAYESELSSGALILDDNITGIGPGVFGGANNNLLTAMTSVTIPASVTSIGAGAFQYQQGLATLTWTGTAGTTLGNDAFRQCTALSSVTLPATIETIGDYAFQNCGLLVSFPLTTLTALTSIGQNAFYRTNLSGPLDLSGLTALTIIGDSAFSYTGLSSVILPSSLQILRSSVFEYCASLVWVKWPVSAADAMIGYMAFNRCTNLVKVELPDKLFDSIPEYTYLPCAFQSSVFNGCTALQVLIIRTGATGKGPDDSWPGHTHRTDCIPKNDGLKIYVPAASVDYYKESQSSPGRYGWGEYVDYLYPDTAIASDGNDPSAW